MGLAICIGRYLAACIIVGLFVLCLHLPRRHIPEDLNPVRHRHENRKSRKTEIYSLFVLVRQ